MHRRVILAIARKDALDALVNKTTLMILLTPILIAVLFTLFSQIFSDKTNDILAYNPGGSAIERVISGAFSNARIVPAGTSAEVAAAFGPDGAQKHSTYSAGLVVPADFESSLRAGGHPQVMLFTNGDEVTLQLRQLLVQGLSDYSRAVATPVPPAAIAIAIAIAIATINPPHPSPVANIGTFYAMAALLTSFMVGSSLMPGLLIEEKERKTLRMLMVSSASWSDIIAGKLIVGLGYQLVLAAVVLAVTKGYVGKVPLILLFALLGACLSLVIGLLFGSLLKTTSTAGAITGMMSFIYILYILPTFFTGVFGDAYSSNAVGQIMHVVPTYYLAEGIFNAMQNRATTSSLALDIAVAAGCTVALFAAAVWALRHQASVVGAL